MTGSDSPQAGLPTGPHAGKPIKQPPILFDETQALLRKLEEASGLPTIVYWNAWNGNICPNDVQTMYQLLSRVGPLEHAAIVIKSYGGSIESALRLVHLLRRYVGRLTAFLMGECASSATIMALGTDEIKMGPLAYLTPIDTSLMHELAPIDDIRNNRVHVSRDELMRIVSLWNDNAKDHHGNPFTDLFNHIHPLVVGAIDRSNSLSAKICDEVLSYHIHDGQIRERIALELNNGFPSHSYPIARRTASLLGLNVSDLEPEVNELLLLLNDLYSEMAQNAITDFDEANYHDHQILGISEAQGVQIHFQNDKDMTYIKEERRWIALNDESTWRKIELIDGEKKSTRVHIA